MRKWELLVEKMKVQGLQMRKARIESLVRFLQCQVSQIRREGIGVLPRKALKLVSLLGPLLLFLPFLLIVRLLRPLIVLRFAPLRSDRIGHFAGNIEVYLCERDAGLNSPSRRFVDVFYYTLPICNSQLKKMWDRTLHICPFDISLLDRLNRLLPGGEEHAILMPHECIDVHGLLASTSPHLSFAPNEEQMGRIGLKDLGVPEGTPFICFHARDSAYLETISPYGDCSYNDYRDSNIHNYMPAVEELTRRGYYAIRMGAVVKEALNTSNDRIIDYATNGKRTDLLDIYLGAKCTFFISSNTGIDAIPEVFRRPLMGVNCAPLQFPRSCYDEYLFIPKKYWLRDERRFMTFREILNSGAEQFCYTHQFEQTGIELIENTPEEIAALAIEMDERLKGTWQTTKEDEELQQCFWSLFKPSELYGNFASRIGAEFLRQHRDWLE
jgi:putative glycosyltransferase (TIGR04372 family)